MGTAARSAALRGVFSGLASYTWWGLAPLFWKLLPGHHAPDLIAHRLVWSVGLLIIVVAWRGQLPALGRALTTPAQAGLHLASGVLLTTNWLVFIYGISSGHVVETSLGYFLLPLVNAALARFVLKESLRPAQKVALALAAVGVAWPLIQLGQFPWIAVSLAVSFGIYGLIRKQSPLGPLTGLAVEVGLIAPFAAAFLVWRSYSANLPLDLDLGGRAWIFLPCFAIITVVPLLLFAFAARRVSFTTLGLMQYVAPTLQFLLGWLLYGEAMSPARLLAFALIWTGLIVFTADQWRLYRRNQIPAISAA